jgi:hypothetical protein
MLDLALTVCILNLIICRVLNNYINIQLSQYNPDLREELGNPSNWTTLGWMEFNAFIRNGEFKERLTEHPDLLKVCGVAQVFAYLFYISGSLASISLLVVFNGNS